MALPGVASRRACRRLTTARGPPSHPPQRVAGFDRNQWLVCVGISGWNASESPAALLRNPHSWSAPRGRPFPGSRESAVNWRPMLTAVARPKGSTVVVRRCRPSICRTWARRDSRAEGGRTADQVLLVRRGHSCSLYVPYAAHRSQGIPEQAAAVRRPLATKALTPECIELHKVAPCRRTMPQIS